MIITVNLNGMYYEFDLTPVKYISELQRGDEVITQHPETKELCKAEVVSRDINYVIVQDTIDEIAPYRWGISRLQARRSVYKVNKNK